MLPAAQLKMLRYMRNAEPKRAGGNDDGPGDGVDVDADSAVPFGSPQKPPTNLPQTSVPLSARKQLAEAAKIPVPVSHRAATPGWPTNGAFPIASPSPKHAQQQLFAQEQPEQQEQQEQQQQQQIWEDSSINSMFTESVATVTRPAQRAATPGRYGSPLAQQRAQHHYERTTRYRDTVEAPSGPRRGGDRGALRNLPANGHGETAAAAPAAHADDPYGEQSIYGSPSKPIPALKHAKYALRDSRGDTRRRPSLSERQPASVFDDSDNGGSPGRRLVHGRGESIPMQSGSAAVDVGRRIAEEDLGDAPRPVLFRQTLLHDEFEGEDGDGDILSQDSDEAANQRTPRQTRSLPPGPRSAVPQKRLLQESSLPRLGADGAGGGGGSGAWREATRDRKRRPSPDYDDSILHAMDYADLREEPFDHDPTRTAGQALAASAAGKPSLEERLVLARARDAASQQRFFTEMPVKEWDACGDWFLEQFAALSNRIREKRLAKRRTMAAFEAEIAEREQLVRRKAESIERTLGELKHEGEDMMRGKSVSF